ncbi:MAG: T9SS type A sorting domain-containing protein [Flavobacteriales bacterium]|jgi:hypothetical protein|nr:T9SS type A sorting domain-containing protein [Flavobacteriales bacterium]
MEYTAGDTCFEPDHWTSMLVAGCGGPYYWSVQLAGPLQLIHELQYFRKGEVECGTLIMGSNDLVPTQQNVGLHPNPGTNGFAISGLGSRSATLHLYDMRGRLVLSGITTTDQQPVDLDHLQSGSYLVVVTMTDGRRQVLRWLKE